ncbi:arginine--tRNA ligase [Salmonella enterica subsp. enterica]|nr:arginine--tRNA ligase [Salmonella enterica subsp. enterica]
MSAASASEVTSAATACVPWGKLLNRCNRHWPPSSGRFLQPTRQTIVVDYSAPNVAKGPSLSLRSTIIGDAAVRTLGFWAIMLSR